uniref:Ribosomal RNA large subunit methyltransferase K/L-like methyltransferase domain-containing protein n=1 Tax=Chromera velia CCMP2878 TaxID=1169474 RepID=A0A0G4FN36_9ALVE|eukprot:Cvel_17893.t1-p1 / transcript=Cvel_17893.t1 / gene=Cvel_17893 / organism=Chromera_velia_CCMP2878 / gene_product=hypothetical protein / transcript_product=hypothetical protein / location=Cvel_scaffold1452:15661-18212(+) / protein_length=630 / sequence_SO=supercontig / SO=protein_coding / is_pseudo=false
MERLCLTLPTGPGLRKAIVREVTAEYGTETLDSSKQGRLYFSVPAGDLTATYAGFVGIGKLRLVHVSESLQEGTEQREPACNVQEGAGDLESLVAARFEGAVVDGIPKWSRLLPVARLVSSCSLPPLRVSVSVHKAGDRARTIRTASLTRQLVTVLQKCTDSPTSSASALASESVCAERGGEERKGFEVRRVEPVLKNPDVIVIVTLNDRDLLIDSTVPAVREGAGEGCDVLETMAECSGLKLPVAWALVQSANLQDGEVMMDPMAGSGAIPLVATATDRRAGKEQSILVRAADASPSQLQRASRNLSRFPSLALFSEPLDAGSATAMAAFTDVTVIVCDLPFGIQHTAAGGETLEALYALVIGCWCPLLVSNFRHKVEEKRDTGPHIGATSSMECRSESGNGVWLPRTVLLTSAQMAKHLQQVVCAQPGWSVAASRRCSLGPVKAVIVCARWDPPVNLQPPMTCGVGEQEGEGEGGAWDAWHQLKAVIERTSGGVGREVGSGSVGEVERAPHAEGERREYVGLGKGDAPAVEGHLGKASEGAMSPLCESVSVPRPVLASAAEASSPQSLPHDTVPQGGAEERGKRLGSRCVQEETDLQALVTRFWWEGPEGRSGWAVGLARALRDAAVH